MSLIDDEMSKRKGVFGKIKENIQKKWDENQTFNKEMKAIEKSSYQTERKRMAREKGVMRVKQARIKGVTKARAGTGFQRATKQMKKMFDGSSGVTAFNTGLNPKKKKKGKDVFDFF